MKITNNKTIWLLSLLMIIKVQVFSQKPEQPPPPAAAVTPERPSIPSPPPPSIISGGIINGRIIDLPVPKFTDAAKSANASGIVEVKVLVDGSGIVISATAVSGHPLLIKEAEKSAKSAKFKPFALSGKPVKIDGKIVYYFGKSGVITDTKLISDLMLAPELAVETGHANDVDKLWLSFDDKTLISQSSDRTIIWDMETESSLLTLENAKIQDITPDGKVLATEQIEDNIKLYAFWDIATGQKLSAFTGGNDCYFNFSGKLMVCKSNEDKSLLVVDYLTKKAVQKFDLPQTDEKNIFSYAENKIKEFALGADDKIVFSNGKKLNVWNTKIKKIELTILDVESWRVSDDGGMLVIKDADTNSRIFDLANNNLEVFRQQNAGVVAISDGGKYVALVEGSSGKFSDLVIVKEVKSGEVKLTHSRFVSYNFVSDDVYQYYDSNRKKIIIRDFGEANAKAYEDFFSRQNSVNNNFVVGERDGKFDFYNYKTSELSSFDLKNTELKKTKLDKVVVLNNQRAKSTDSIKLNEPQKGKASQMVMKGSDGTASLINGNKGKNVSSLREYIFNPNSNTLVRAASGGGIDAWSLMSGEKTKGLGKYVSEVNARFSEDGLNIEVKNRNTPTKQLNLSTGQLSIQNSVETNKSYSQQFDISFDRRGKNLILKSRKSKSVLLNLDEVSYFEISKDNKTLACLRSDDSYWLEVYDTTTGKLLFSLNNIDEGKYLYSGSESLNLFSPNSLYMALLTDYGSRGKDSMQSFEILSSRTGKKIFTKDNISSFTFDDKWRNLIVRNYYNGDNPGLIEWFSFSNNSVKKLNYSTEYDIDFERYFAVPSPDKKFVAFRHYEDNNFILWNTQTNDVSSVYGHASSITNIEFSSDSHRFISSGKDGVIKFWDAENSESILTFIPLEESSWVAVAPDGRFDTNKSLDEIKGLSWKLPTDKSNQKFPLEIFMRQYYEPGLLPRTLNGETFKALPGIGEINRVQPKVIIKEIIPNGDAVDITIEIEDVNKEIIFVGQTETFSSGAFDLRLFSDGQMIGRSTPKSEIEKYNLVAPRLNGFDEKTAWKKANDISKIAHFNDHKRATLTFKNIRLPRDGRKEFEFTAYAFNSDKVKSDNSVKIYKLPANVSKPPKKGRAFVVSIGVNASENPAYNLRYAANDARKMQEIVGAKLKADGAKYSEVVEIPLISDYDADKKIKANENAARKSVIKGVFSLLAGNEREVPADVLAQIPNRDKIKPIEPEDTLIITYSGHGYADNSGIFYLLPYDIGKETLKLNPENLGKMISSDELSLWMQDITAAEMMMVIDACHSAAAVQGDGFKPGPMGSRGLGQLAYDKDMKILSATQADNVALELGSLQQGLLSYALLQDGIVKSLADTDHDKQLFSNEWLKYAEQRVPELYSEVRNGKRDVTVNGKDIKADGKRSEIVDLSGDQKSSLNLQQPTVFDFKRRKTLNNLFTLP